MMFAAKYFYGLVFLGNTFYCYKLRIKELGNLCCSINVLLKAYALCNLNIFGPRTSPFHVFF